MKWCSTSLLIRETQIKATVTLSPHLSCSLQLYSSNQSKGCQSWVFTGRTDVEAETPIFWPPDAKSCSIPFEKTLMLGKIEGRRRRG